mgnify:CR=1 FL=1
MPDGFAGFQHGGACPDHATILSPSPPPAMPSPPPPDLQITVPISAWTPQGSALGHDLSLYADHHYMVHFDVDQGHPVAQFDMAFFVPSTYADCMVPPVPQQLGGFVDAQLSVGVSLPLGTFYLCLRQETTITAFKYITAHTVSAMPRHPPVPPHPPPLYDAHCYGEPLHNTSYTGDRIRGFSGTMDITEAGLECLQEPECAAVVRSPLPVRNDLHRFTLRKAGGATLADVPRTVTMFKDPQGLCKPPPPSPAHPPSPSPPPPPSPPHSPPLYDAQCYQPLLANTEYTGSVIRGFSGGPDVTEAGLACLQDSDCVAMVQAPLPVAAGMYRYTLRRAGGTTAAATGVNTVLRETTGACNPPSPPSPPPPTPSPPPSPGLPPVEAVVVFSAVVDATVETFDDAAYRQRIATRLGVPLSAVQTTVAPGSVIVVTEVSTSAEAAAQIVASVETLVNDPDAAADMYGAPATVSSAVTQMPPSPPPSPSTPPLPPLPPLPAPPPGASGEDDNSGLLVALLIVGGIVLLIVVGVVVYTLQGQQRAKVEQTPAEEKVSLKSAGRKVVARNKLTPRSSGAQPVGYGRRSGYAYAQVARAAHSSGGGGSSQQEFRFSL